MESEHLPAGNFSEWLRAMRDALGGGAGMDVACGDCVGCCTSSYFIKIRAHETAALSRIPVEHLEHAPGATGGNWLMGYRDNGHCPMFGPGGCSIYQDRPENCRTYDCRIFTAVGMNAGPDRSVINQRIGSWGFSYPTDTAKREQHAVTRAANFLRQHPVKFPSGRIPSRPSEIAVLAVKVYGVFMDPPASHAEISAAIIAAAREFDQRKPA